MYTILKRIVKIFTGKDTRTEIEKVEDSLKKHKQKLYEMDDAFDPKKDCCQQCLYGLEYSELYAKIKRVEKWLIVLKNRKNKLK